MDAFGRLTLLYDICLLKNSHHEQDIRDQF